MRITKIHNSWTRQAIVLRYAHIVLVVTATISSILAAAGFLKGWRGIDNPLSILAAIAIGLVSAFELGNKANDFWDAWRMLHAAIIRFEEEPEYTIEQLVKAYEESEKLVGSVKTAPER